MKKLCHTYILMAALLIIAGCAQETDYPFLEPEPVTRYHICWSVAPEGTTRALTNINRLQETCTPVAGGSNESIGVWGEYTADSDGQNLLVKEFTATPLTYIPGTFNSWEYPGEPRYWELRATYDFRACYPQKLMTSLMTQMDATMFQGGPVNTMILQEDIMVAATQVDTRVSTFSETVHLSMQHIFAAIQFKVRAAEGFTPAMNEAVTSCWLQNSNNETNLFSPSGYLVHSGNVSPEIVWHTYEASSAPMYVWQHEGVSFINENILYSPNGGLEGEKYTGNDGWLLVVPQVVKEGTLDFCYTLKNAGEQIFSVKIPPITYEYGKKYTYTLEIRGSEAELNLTIAPWNYIESSYDITI